MRSIINTPSAMSLRAFSWCACAEVASKAMRMPSRATCGTRPSTPAAVVATPSADARRSPSDAGSMPTTHAGSIHSLRRALKSRSVPMLPEPRMAALIFMRASIRFR